MNRLDEILNGFSTEGKPPMTKEEFQKRIIDDYNNMQGNLNELDGYNCELCKNKGFIARINEEGYEVHSECQCKTIRSTLRRAQRSGLGDILTEFTFKKFIATEEWQENIKSRAQRFCADDEAKWFYIGGQVGAGKSHLCTAIAAHYIKAGKNVKYMLWHDEAKKLKSLANDYAYQDLIREYKDIEVLYIDDFLKVKFGETPTTGDINLAFEIINYRLLDREKITIISSEKTLDELIDYDEATISRVFKETGKQYRISIGKDRAKNYRLRDV